MALRMCMRIFLASLNMLIGFFALLLLGVGAFGLTTGDVERFEAFDASSGTTLRTGAWTLVGLSGTILLVAFMGCCGALKQLKIFLIIYSVIMVVVMLMTTAAASVLIVARSTVVDEIKNQLRDSVTKYDENDPNNNITRMWDGIQKDGDCCGVNEFADWWTNEQFNAAGRRFPASCCKRGIDCNPFNPAAGSFNVYGCFEFILRAFNLVFSVMAFGAVALTVTLGFAVFCAIWIACTTAAAK